MRPCDVHICCYTSKEPDCFAVMTGETTEMQMMILTRPAVRGGRQTTVTYSMAHWWHWWHSFFRPVIFNLSRVSSSTGVGLSHEIKVLCRSGRGRVLGRYDQEFPGASLEMSRCLFRLSKALTGSDGSRHPASA